MYISGGYFHTLVVDQANPDASVQDFLTAASGLLDEVSPKAFLDYGKARARMAIGLTIDEDVMDVAGVQMIRDYDKFVADHRGNGNSDVSAIATILDRRNGKLSKVAKHDDVFQFQVFKTQDSDGQPSDGIEMNDVTVLSKLTGALNAEREQRMIVAGLAAGLNDDENITLPVYQGSFTHIPRVLSAVFLTSGSSLMRSDDATMIDQSGEVKVRPDGAGVWNIPDLIAA